MTTSATRLSKPSATGIRNVDNPVLGPGDWEAIDAERGGPATNRLDAARRSAANSLLALEVNRVVLLTPPNGNDEPIANEPDAN